MVWALWGQCPGFAPPLCAHSLVQPWVGCGRVLARVEAPGVTMQPPSCFPLGAFPNTDPPECRSGCRFSRRWEAGGHTAGSFL